MKPALLLSFALVACTATVASAQGNAPPDPTENPLMLTSGFLSHHPDMQYRLWGLRAYKEKRFETALQYFRRAGYYADKPSQGMVAEMYWKGEGTPRDAALAYAWMDLAAERGYEGFLGLRERYWKQLDGAERERAVREGQAIYATFGDAAAKPRYEAQLRIGRRSIVGSRTGFAGNVKIDVPGPAGSNQTIDGSKFYDERYWDAKKYWAWQDTIWKRPRVGRVTVGELEQIGRGAPGSRVPEVAPRVDAPMPDAPEPPDGDAPR
jgi:hypothetical protein